MPETANPLLTFAKRLHEGPPAFAAWCSMRDASVVEGLLRDGYDCAILDWQHGFHDFASIQNAILAAYGASKAALVRIGVGQFNEAARFLDWGASGIIAPMINSAEDAKALVNYLKFPPLGGRSWGPTRALGFTGFAPVDYLKSINGLALNIAMIETREALAALDDILSVEGIDGVLVGPGDLSITLTNGGTVNALHPEVDKALTHIAARTRAAGKIASAFSPDGARAGELAARGFHLLSVATDQNLLRIGGRAELAKARELAPKTAGSGY